MIWIHGSGRVKDQVRWTVLTYEHCRTLFLSLYYKNEQEQHKYNIHKSLALEHERSTSKHVLTNTMDDGIPAFLPILALSSDYVFLHKMICTKDETNRTSGVRPSVRPPNPPI